MITDLARYQGVALREVILEMGCPLRIATAPDRGRADCFWVESQILHIKYSTKRLSPWPFTFTGDQLGELAELRRVALRVWVVFVCGIDGTMVLQAEELDGLIGGDGTRTCGIRIRRKRNGRYRVSGPRGDLPYTKARGVGDIVDALRGAVEEAR